MADDDGVLVDAPARGGVGPDAVAPELAALRRADGAAPAPPRGRPGGGWFGVPLPWAPSRTVIDRPDICVTVASSFPDRLRLLKRVHLFPLRLTLRCDYVRRTRQFECGCSAQDALLGGDVRLDAATRSLQYHKRVPLGGGAHVGVFGGVSLDGLMRGDVGTASLKPTLAFRYELGGGGAVWSEGAVAVRQKVRLAKGLALEARGSVRLPTPRAELSLGRGGGDGRGGGRVSLGDGGPLHFHLEELNAVLWV